MKTPAYFDYQNISYTILTLTARVSSVFLLSHDRDIASGLSYIFLNLLLKF